MNNNFILLPLNNDTTTTTPHQVKSPLHKSVVLIKRNDNETENVSYTYDEKNKKFVDLCSVPEHYNH